MDWFLTGLFVGLEWIASGVVFVGAFIAIMFLITVVIAIFHRKV